MRFEGDFTGRPSEMVSNAIVKVGAGELAANLAMVLVSYSKCFAQHSQKYRGRGFVLSIHTPTMGKHDACCQN